MKKAVFLLAALVLCLSLCACSGMAGKEAALLYPDIIGKWGTDPFGEEFILTLSEDGSCTVLDNQGTWTLNKKNSNEDRVELNIKTEAMKYHVQLGRVQDQWTSVYLWIADTKKATTIFDGEVFAQGTEYTFADLAIQTVPELIGEWGTTYWNEESVLTIREDGTCTLLRQSGRWCLFNKAATWPEIVIYVKLDNGTKYRLPFHMLEMDWGYHVADLRINDIATDTYLLSDPDRDYPIFRVSNRKQLIHPMDFAAVAVGEWAESKGEKPFAEFNEDGTCMIRGAEGLWTLDYTAYYKEKYRNGWDYCLRAKISGDEYDICFTDDGEGLYNMYILNQDDGIYILDASEVIKLNAE